MITVQVLPRATTALLHCSACIKSYKQRLFRTFATSHPNSSSSNLSDTGGKVDVLPLERPIEPGPEDCCQSGCIECVWEVYRKDLIEYNRKLAELQGKPPPPPVVDPFEELERKIAQQKEHQRSLEKSLTK